MEGLVYVDAPRWLRDRANDVDNEIEWLDDSATDRSAPERFALLQRLYA